ncbi:hypothetical protein [Pseudonocardia sp. KRD291]|uniref:hypothetical protein n=1 Tax=Pseudonocardia sp. KRD291 TaxID=2792007 RepID=UPI001C49E0D1|nr:hypothetical protein [Pseudonocardia sp. KRD291]MBW0105285.1 hypothetical protein [Pseudonocardia sp. KRD291]
MGRALLWWPFTAFALVAAFPAIAVPAMVGSGVLLVLIGLVGGALGKRWRARRLRRAGRTIGALPRTVAEGPDDPPADVTPASAGTPDAAPGDEPDDEGPDVRAA